MMEMLARLPAQPQGRHACSRRFCCRSRRRANDFNGLDCKRRSARVGGAVACRASGARPVQWGGEMLTRAGDGFPEFNFSKVEFGLYQQPWQAYYTQGRTGRRPPRQLPAKEWL